MQRSSTELLEKLRFRKNDINSSIGKSYLAIIASKMLFFCFYFCYQLCQYYQFRVNKWQLFGLDITGPGTDVYIKFNSSCIKMY